MLYNYFNRYTTTFAILLISACIIPTTHAHIRGSLKAHHDEFQSRIVGGNPAGTDEFKFFASLDIGCGGSLIAPDIVLTAAHCAGDIHTARIGSNNIDSGGSLHTVTTQCQHPDYNPKTTANDYMLLKLETPVDTDTYPVIQLNNNNTVPQVDQMLTVIGFGDTSEGGLGSYSRSKSLLTLTKSVTINMEV
jgi:secreted trypsin-like serine protease